MDIGKSLEYAFSEKEWIKKFGVTFVALFIIYGLSRFVAGVFNIASLFFFEDGQLASEYFLPYLASYAFILVAALLSVPLSIYFGGYSVKIYENVGKKKDEVPAHDDIIKTFLDGLKIWGISFVYGSVPIILVMVLLFLLLVAVVLLIQGSAPILGIVLGIIAGILLLASVAFMMAVTLLVIPAGTYNFLKRKQLVDAFKFKEVLEIIQKGWKSLLLAAVYNFLVIVTINIGSIVFFCIAFVIQPVVQAYTIYFSSHLYGQLYAELKRLKL